MGRPHSALAGLVDTYLGYRQELPGPGVHRGLPSCVMTVVFAFDEPLRVGWQDGPAADHWALASGLHTRPAQIQHHGRQHGIQIGLTAAGARQLLGVPLGALATEIVPLTEFIHPSWQARLAEQQTWSGRYAVLDTMLLDLLRARADVPTPRPELAHSLHRIRTTSGRVRVAELAGEVGWSRRHFGAEFRAEVGLTPKEVIRVARFERSRTGLAQGVPAADVAAVCGYADQAHLSREWRALAGCTPREWQRAELPFLQDFLTGTGDSGVHE